MSIESHYHYGRHWTADPDPEGDEPDSHYDVELHATDEGNDGERHYRILLRGIEQGEARVVHAFPDDDLDEDDVDWFEPTWYTIRLEAVGLSNTLEREGASVEDIMRDLA